MIHFNLRRNAIALLIVVCCFLGRAHAQLVTQNFSYTGGQQSFVVPAGVTSLGFTVIGAQGGDYITATGGYGGTVSGTLAVTPGQTLYLNVGGVGLQTTAIAYALGGYNGGGYVIANSGISCSGGGASDIRIGGTSLANRVVVAGGGGGASSGGPGGSGNYPNGNTSMNGPNPGGGGGTQTTGGTAYSYSTYFAQDGTLGQGGANCTGTSTNSNQGAGGGGGYYGGGGSAYRGGGGGSSYYNPSVTSNVTAGQLFQNSTPASIQLTYGIAPAFINQPGNVNACPNTYVTLQAMATGNVTYQWYFNGNPISGATGASLGIVVTTGTAGGYYVSATNSYGTTNSNTANVSASGGLQINTQPVSAAICTGGSTSFTIAASGTGLSYQWQVNAGGGFTNLGNTAGLYSGVNTNSLQISGAALSMSGRTYMVVITGICGTISSAPDTLTVRDSIPAQPTFTAGPPAVALGQTGVIYAITSQNNVGYTWAYTGANANVTVNSLGTTANLDFGGNATPGSVTVFASSTRGCGVSATAARAVVIKPSFSWTGAIDRDWNNAGNWDAGAVPVTATNVSIPGTPNTPRITGGITVDIKNLSLNAAALLTIDSLSKLRVFGNASTYGSVRGAGILSFCGTATQILTASDTIYNLELNNAAGLTLPLGSNIQIKQRYYPTLGTFTNSGTVILVSDATGTATIGRGPAGGNYFAGNVQVQQYIPGKRAYRFLAHPFNGNVPLSQLTSAFDISGTSGSAGGFTTSYPNIATAFWYNPLTATGNTRGVDAGWIPYTNMNDTGVNRWTPMEGIRVLIRGQVGQGLTTGATYTPLATTINMAGTPAQGDRTAALGNNANRGFNVVGNPYASAIDLSTIDYSPSVAPNIWIWDANQGRDGGYISQPRNIPYVLPAYSAFEIRTIANTSASVTFHESSKSIKKPNALFKTTDDEGNNVVQLHITSNFKTQSWDRLLIYFNDTASAASDDLDGEKLQNDDLNFYSYSTDSVQQSIDVRPYVAGQVIRLGITTDVQQIYEMGVDNFDVAPNVVVYLHDKYLHKVEQLSAGYEYEFDVTSDTASQGDNRFELNLDTPPTGIVNVNASGTFHVSIAPNPAVNVAVLTYTASVSGATSMKVTNIVGQQVYAQELGNQQSGKVTIPVAGLPSGIYMVTLKCGDEVVTKRLVKE